MTDQVLNVLGGTETSTPIVTDPVITDPTNATAGENLDLSKYSEIIGEGKKYATAEEALRGLIAAQTHIKNIEGENSELREDLTKRSNAEEILERIKAANQKDELTSSENTVDQEAIRQLVSDVVKEEGNAKVKSDNLKVANLALFKEFGNKATEVVNKKSQELGITLDEFANLASNSPKALLAMMGIQQNDNGTSSETLNMNSDVNTQTSSMNLQTKRNYAYYKKLREDDPKSYYTPSLQHQYHKDARDAGDSFYE